jgi:hypothetical protein
MDLTPTADLHDAPPAATQNQQVGSGGCINDGCGPDWVAPNDWGWLLFPKINALYLCAVDSMQGVDLTPP